MQNSGSTLAWDQYAYVFNNPLRYIDPSGHLTEEQLKELLGDDYDMLMELWKRDPYWLDVLAHLEVGGILTATLMESWELHIETAGDKVQAVMYNREGRSYAADLRFWQGKGAYLIRNPGETEEQSLKNRDVLFNKHAVFGAIISPAFDYDKAKYGSQGTPQYVGAVRTVQSVQPTYATMGDYVHVPVVDYLLGSGAAAVAVKLAETAEAGGAGFGVYLAEAFVFSIASTYQRPRVYSCGWSWPAEPHRPELNPDYPWR